MAQKATKMTEGNVVPFADEVEVDLEACPDIVEEIERLWAQIDDIMDKAREECAPLRDEIGEYVISIHDKTGFARKAINVSLSDRKQKIKTSRKLAKLSEQHREQAGRLTGALPAAKVQYTLDL